MSTGQMPNQTTQLYTIIATQKKTRLKRVFRHTNNGQSIFAKPHAQQM
jgi:hypothetical protein